MATVKQISGELDAMIPRSLSCDWDNDGLLVCPKGSKRVRRVLLALDATKSVCEEAKDFDLLITHHPIIFHKIGEMSDQKQHTKKIIDLICSHTAVMSFHTRFDAADGGINDILAEKLGISDVKKFAPEGEIPIGRIGNVAPTDAKSLCEKVKSALGSPFVLCADAGKTISRLAVCGGDGGDYIDAALAAGADAIVTGRGGYNRNIDARDDGITVIEAGHYYSEAVFAEYFEKFFAENHPEIEVVRSKIGCEIKAF